MQLMPGTAADLGVEDAFDPEQNLDGGTRHLVGLIARYGGDVKRALAAYNAGEGAVERHRGVPPYGETRAYVRNVLRRYRSGT
jgi:soluble lytic murein transglycosylase-like protein